MQRSKLLLTKAEAQAILLAINDCTGEVDDCDLHNQRTTRAFDRMREIKNRLMTTKETEIK